MLQLLLCFTNNFGSQVIGSNKFNSKSTNTRCLETYTYMVTTCAFVVHSVHHPSNNSCNIFSRSWGATPGVILFSSMYSVYPGTIFLVIAVRSLFLSLGSGTFHSFLVAYVLLNSDLNLGSGEWFIPKQRGVRLNKHENTGSQHASK